MINDKLLAAATASGEKVVNFCTTLLATGEEVFGSDQTSTGVSNVWMDDLEEQSKQKKRREVYERANCVQSVFGQKMLQRKDSRRERGKAVGTENPLIFRKAIKPGKATSCSIFNTWVLRLVSGNFLVLSRTPNSANVQAAVWSDHIVSFVF